MQNSPDFDLYHDVANPLDGVEEIMRHNDWTFQRHYDDLLTVQISGKNGTYDLSFSWQEEFTALQFTCVTDFSVPAASFERACHVLQTVNPKLWLGHFDLYVVDGIYYPRFKHTCLFRGLVDTSGIEILEDVIDIALSECERYAMTFDMMGQAALSAVAQDQLQLSMMDVVGQS